MKTPATYREHGDGNHLMDVFILALDVAGDVAVLANKKEGQVFIGQIRWLRVDPEWLTKPEVSYTEHYWG